MTLLNRSITRYLNSVAVFSPDEPAAKTPAELQREQIAATVTKTELETVDNKEEVDEIEDNKEEEKDGEEDEETEEDKDDENGEKDPPENETDEQKKERIAAERQARKDARMQKRIDKLTADNNLTKQENERLRKQLEANPDNKLTEEEVQARAEKLAADIVNKRTAEEIQQHFQKEADKLQAAAEKADKEFLKNINEAAAEVAPIPAIMIGILNELDNENGGEVLAHLAKNVDEYEDMFRDNGGTPVPINESRMTAKLIRLSDRLKAEKEAAEKATKDAKKKERSKVPDPITPVNEGRDAKSSTVLPNNPTKSAEDMQTFVRIRNEQVAARRKANGGLL